MSKCIDCANFQPHVDAFGYCPTEDIYISFYEAVADAPCPYFLPIDEDILYRPDGGQKLARCIDCRWCRHHSKYKLLFCYVFDKVLTRQQAMSWHRCDCYVKCPEYILKSRIVNGKLVFRLVRRGC